MSNSILKISEATSIAFHAMIFLSLNKNHPVSVKEIAEKFSVSENHLSKVMQRLAKVGLVVSIKGPHGGFKLTRDDQDISFLEIYEAIEGSIKQTCCLFGKAECNSKSCIMGDLLKNTNKEVIDYFKNKKLSDFKSIEECP